VRSRINKALESHQSLSKTVMDDQSIVNNVEQAINQLVDTFKAGGKVLFCGNGGSAADAQHLAAELSGRFYLDRKALHAEALHVNSSYLTAVANDMGFDQVFSRALDAKAKPADLLLAFSTSGSSQNILNAVKHAKTLQVKTIGFTGSNGTAFAEYCDLSFIIPSSDTPRIQEMHLLLGHIICDLVEQQLFSNPTT